MALLVKQQDFLGQRLKVGSVWVLVQAVGVMGSCLGAARLGLFRWLLRYVER